MILGNLTEWLGYPVEVYLPGKTTPDYQNKVYRIASEYDDEETLEDKLAQFLDAPGSADTSAIIIGLFGEHDATPQPCVEMLVAARQRLPKLRGLFIGDIVSEENEISWIQQTDLSPLFSAFPKLETFRARGGNGLGLGRINHPNLRTLIVESGGLPVTVLRDVLNSKLPALEHLELWLGTENYGWDGAVEDLDPLFTGDLFPKLKYLGLRDSEIADAIAVRLARAPILHRLEVLDLSLGTLGDEGARALLASPAIKSLKKLDLHRHYISPDVMSALKASGLNVDLSDPEDEDSDGDRYVAVGE